MYCPNCGQPYEEGATVCPHCGAPLPLGEREPAIPASSPLSMEAPAAARPASSGMAKASLWVGIAALAMIILALLAVVGAGFIVADRAPPGFWDEFIREASEGDPEDLQELVEDPGVEAAFGQGGIAVLGSGGCCLLGELAALLGLVFGIVGLSQERDQPTQRGRTHSIVGLVLSVIPLLCCAVFLIFVMLPSSVWS